MLGVFGWLLWYLISSIASDWKSAPSQPPEPEVSINERAATLINLSGHLCAKAVFISAKLGSGDQKVNCEEYRDARKSGTKNNMVIYMVNSEMATVKLVGRN